MACAHITCGEYAFLVGRKILRRHIAALIKLNPQLSKHAVWLWMQEAHRQKCHITRNDAFTAHHFVKAWSLTGGCIFPNDVSDA
ncbi:Uncharacterised protein [Vibrio cholerae]|nr:Uncharacterised protein [Vibrio cholerae]CSI80286.1 Uncharacterised protein [Vibrio cholerae]